jgi:hypothetical protein
VRCVLVPDGDLLSADDGFLTLAVQAHGVRLLRFEA